MHDRDLRALDDAGARRWLLHLLWQHGRIKLLLAAIVPAVVAWGLSDRWLVLGYRTYDGTHIFDAGLRTGLALIAIAIVVGGANALPQLLPVLQRLPVDPAALLRARLQLALMVGALAFGTVLAAEYLTAPPMMHPSVPGRLNPAERATLGRLPGIPLLRFTVGERVTLGLAHELSIAAMRSDRRIGAGISNYGSDQRRHHFSEETPTPGTVLAKVEASDWTALDRWHRRRLQKLGVPRGATVEIALERYLSAEEYASSSWRRDGLGRERRWHALDRAAGFFGLLVILTCLLHKAQKSLLVGVLPAFTIILLNWKDPIFLPARTWLLRSNLQDGTPILPTLAPQLDVVELLLWPASMVAASLLSYRIAAHQMRSDVGLVATPKSFAASVRWLWRGGTARRVELVGLLLFFGFWLVAMLGQTAQIDFRATRPLLTSVGLVGSTMVTIWLVSRWRERDPLISRLPAPSGQIANQRLGQGILVLGGIAFAFALTDFVLARLASTDVLATDESSPIWAKSLVMVASSLLVMITALLGDGKGNINLLPGLFMLPGWFLLLLMGTTHLTWPSLASLVVLSVGPWAIYRILKRRVVLGRAPTLAEALAR